MNLLNLYCRDSLNSEYFILPQVRKLPHISHVEEEDIAFGDQNPKLAWHLDRLDQESLPLDLSYQPIGSGEGVDVYILDSGINYDHEEFEYRAKYAGKEKTVIVFIIYAVGVFIIYAVGTLCTKISGH